MLTITFFLTKISGLNRLPTSPEKAHLSTNKLWKRIFKETKYTQGSPLDLLLPHTSSLLHHESAGDGRYKGTTHVSLKKRSQWPWIQIENISWGKTEKACVAHVSNATSPQPTTIKLTELVTSEERRGPMSTSFSILSGEIHQNGTEAGALLLETTSSSP